MNLAGIHKINICPEYNTKDINKLVVFRNLMTLLMVRKSVIISVMFLKMLCAVSLLL